MKIVISGGGTGGHIYPALTIAAQLQKVNPKAEITFVGTKAGLEKDIVPRYGYPLEYISVAGFERKFSLQTICSAGKLLVGMVQAFNLLRRLKPDLVIGTGGYVCGPILFWAAMRGVPACIQEQNAMPGVTNKILARFVDKIFLGYKEGARYFPGEAKKDYTGNPVRSEVMSCSKEKGWETFGLDPAKVTILAFGGSRGARTINAAMAQMETNMAGRTDVQILHATGSLDYEKYMAALDERVKTAENIKILPYIHAMPAALAVADLAVSRAGAIGLAELMVKGVPSILIPYPYATANHQEFNARALENVGAAKVILNKDLTGVKLQETIENLLLHKDEMTAMHQAAIKAGMPQAAADIAAKALELVEKKGK